MSNSEAIEATESRFRPIAELGEGGMAKVHLAVARGPNGFNKLVVLKTLRQSMAEDASFVEMFMDEARLAAQLNHPNVVQTYEVTVEEGLPVIVMEYLEGQPLSQLLVRAKGPSPLPLMMHLTVLCDVLAGLHYAHELVDFEGERLNLVHRDVSPDNVFVTFDGQVKLLDFGIAKVATCSPGQTGTGVVKGKVRYMAPEQMEGIEVDRRADVYAVGAMLWEALANERIWTGLADVAIMNRVSRHEFPPIRSRNADAPEALERICAKAMSGDPSQRYETAQAFQLALEHVMGEMGTAVRPRDVGLWVANLFADTRARIRTIVEAEMNRVGTLSPSAASRLRIISLPKLATTPTPRNVPEAGELPSGSQTRRDRLRFVSVVAALALTLVLAWIGARQGSQSNPSPEVAPVLAPAVTASVAGAGATAAKTVEIVLTAMPVEARLFFDDELVPGNPGRLVRPPDGTMHSVRASAPGFGSKTTPVTLDHDSNVSIALERQIPTPAATAVRPPAARSGPPAAAGSAAPARKPNCSQPYYFDERGIKKIRDECL